MSGVHGLATTFGRIPFHYGSTSTLNKGGPIGASSLDVAIAYLVVAPSAKDHFYTQLYGMGHLDQRNDDGSSVLQQRNDSYSKLSLIQANHLTQIPPPHIQNYVSNVGEKDEQAENLADIRLGVFPDWFNDSQVEIKESCYKAIDYFKRQGAKIVEIDIPYIGLASLAHAMIISSEFATDYDIELYRKPSRYSR